MKKIINCPAYIKEILHILHTHHAEAFLVGGCVRDLLLNRTPNDYDITTNAKANYVLTIFENAGYKVIPTGIKHGTVTVFIDSHPIEITTYRIEQDYHNHRSPSSILFTNNIEEDLARRDFTVNAMAYDITNNEIIDPFHGQIDLKNKIIRCVGNPSQRFQEDALRILRAVRFAMQLQFTIEEHTKQAIINCSQTLQFLSKERIRDEFNKILICDYKNTLQTLRDYKLLEWIIPSIQSLYDHQQKTPWHCYDIFTHTDVALNHSIAADLCMKLALVFHDIGKVESEVFDEEQIAHYPKHAVYSEKIARDCLKALHYDNKTINKVCTYIIYHDYFVTPKKSILRKYLAHFPSEMDALKTLDIQKCDNYAKHPAHVDQLVQNVIECKNILQEIIDHHDYVSKKELAINGNDLILFGYQGKQIAYILDKCFQFVTKYPNKNNKQDLIKYIKMSNF